jgi:hypothetical protein
MMAPARNSGFTSGCYHPAKAVATWPQAELGNRMARTGITTVKTQALSRGQIMRTFLKALLLVGFGAIQVSEAAPSASAADLAVTPVKRVAVRVIHHRSAVVRDYDGTMVIRRAHRVVVRNDDGTALVSTQYDLYPVQRGAGTRYLNGQPVLPHYPRGWPRVRAYSIRSS